MVATWSIYACFSLSNPLVYITGKDLDCSLSFLQLEIRPLHFASFELSKSHLSVSAPKFPTVFAWKNTCYLSAYQDSITGREKWP